MRSSCNVVVDVERMAACCVAPATKELLRRDEIDENGN